MNDALEIIAFALAAYAVIKTLDAISRFFDQDATSILLQKKQGTQAMETSFLNDRLSNEDDFTFGRLQLISGDFEKTGEIELSSNPLINGAQYFSGFDSSPGPCVADFGAINPWSDDLNKIRPRACIDESFSCGICPSINIDGSPMVGDFDINGNPFGVNWSD